MILPGIIRLVAIIFLSLVLFPSSVFASFIKSPSNPILNYSRNDQDPFILKEGNVYKMWFNCHQGSGWRIGYAESTDGKTNWQNIKCPVINVGSNPTWETDTFDPTILKDGSTYKMWYTSQGSRWINGPDRFRLRYATSTNGINWTTNPEWVMYGSQNSWDSGGMSRGTSVIKEGNKYKMWYAGTNSAQMGTQDEKWNIGYAESTDGITWVKTANPVIQSTKPWELNSVSYPRVNNNGQIYQIWYAATNINLPIQFVYAESTDGITWVKTAKNPILTKSNSGFDSQNIQSPFVIKDDNKLKLYYGGYNGLRWSIGYAEEVLPEKIVLLPGLGASWNHENIVLGLDKPNPDWYATPFVHIYDGFIQTLKNLGYQDSGPNRNLFIYYYNWTKPLDQLALDFKAYLDTTVKPQNSEKINLVGHSLGGLVARTYIHKYNPDFINKIITVGSPHQGAAKTYYLWGGGNLTKAVNGWQAVALGLLLNIRQPYHTTKADAIRNIAPVIKDLLPTSDYLKQNGQILSVNSLPVQNSFLSSLNLLSNLNNLNALTGTIPASTLRFIEVAPQEWYNKLLDRWPNGTPTNKNEEFDLGDITVLTTSARYGQNFFEIANLKHSELIEHQTGQQKILEILNLPTDNITVIANEVFANTLVLQLASPAALTITTPAGQTLSGDKLVVIPNAVAGSYLIKVTGTATGNYTLYTGQITDNQDSWLNLSANTTDQKQDNFVLQVQDQPHLEITADTASINQVDARTKINQLKDYLASSSLSASTRRTALNWLNSTLRAYDRAQYEQAILLLYQLRAQYPDRPLKNKVLEIIVPLEKVYLASQTGTYSIAKLTQEGTLAQKYFNQFENKLKTSPRATKDHAWLWENTQEKLALANSQTNSYTRHIQFLGVQYLSQEGLKLLR